MHIYNHIYICVCVNVYVVQLHTYAFVTLAVLCADWSDWYFKIQFDFAVWFVADSKIPLNRALHVVRY